MTGISIARTQPLSLQAIFARVSSVLLSLLPAGDVLRFFAKWLPRSSRDIHSCSSQSAMTRFRPTNPNPLAIQNT